MDLTFDKTELTLEVAKAETLTATILLGDASNKEIEWSSDKPGVATVSSESVIEAKAPGKASLIRRPEWKYSN